MGSPKESAREVLDELPDDCSLEDIQYQLYLRQRLDKSRTAAAEGRVTSHEDVRKRLSKWLER